MGEVHHDADGTPTFVQERRDGFFSLERWEGEGGRPLPEESPLSLALLDKQSPAKPVQPDPGCDRCGAPLCEVGTRPGQTICFDCIAKDMGIVEFDPSRIGLRAIAGVLERLDRESDSDEDYDPLDCRRVEAEFKACMKSPGFDRLAAMCQEETGEEINAGNVRRLAGRLARLTGKRLATIEGNPLRVVLDLMDERVACGEPEDRGRSQTPPKTPPIPHSDSNRAARDGTIPPAATHTSEPSIPSRTRPKKSTSRGEGRAKLIAALTKHHKYADRDRLNTEPIGNNALARLAEVSTSTASIFLKTKFGGYRDYTVLCQNSAIWWPR